MFKNYNNLNNNLNNNVLRDNKNLFFIKINKYLLGVNKYFYKYNINYHDSLYSNINKIIFKFIYKSKVGVWVKKINIISWIFHKMKRNHRFKLVFLNTLISIVFFENTILLKRIYKFWIKYIPLQTHKSWVRKLTVTYRRVNELLHYNKVTMNVLLIFKGKLGLRGDNKKKKNIYGFTSLHKYKKNRVHFYDGIGSSSRFGHTFCRIIYTPAYLYSK